jgi:hypothetical protein
MHASPHLPLVAFPLALRALPGDEGRPKRIEQWLKSAAMSCVWSQE